jgi:hypothetical protein
MNIPMRRMVPRVAGNIYREVLMIEGDSDLKIKTGIEKTRTRGKNYQIYLKDVFAMFP